MYIIDDEIISIEEFDSVEVYDIMMEKDPHNFIANDVVVHNCKAHAVAYSILGYYTAWYKANYPNEFLIANIKNPKSNNDFTESEYINEFIQEARQMGIKVKLPVAGKCQSGPFYDADENCVYLGLSSLKGITDKPAEVIIEACRQVKEEDGSIDLKKFCDFCFEYKITTDRLTKKGEPIKRAVVTKAHLKTLINIGFIEGDLPELIGEYNRLYKEDLEIKDIEQATNEAIGFDFFSPWERYKKLLDIKYHNTDKYLIAKITDKKTGTNKNGYAWNLIKFETELGALSAFVDSISGIDKGRNYVLEYDKSKSKGDTLKVSNIKLL